MSRRKFYHLKVNGKFIYYNLSKSKSNEYFNLLQKIPELKVEIVISFVKVILEDDSE